MSGLRNPGMMLIRRFEKQRRGLPGTVTVRMMSQAIPILAPFAAIGSLRRVVSLLIWQPAFLRSSAMSSPPQLQDCASVEQCQHFFRVLSLGFVITSGRMSVVVYLSASFFVSIDPDPILMTVELGSSDVPCFCPRKIYWFPSTRCSILLAVTNADQSFLERCLAFSPSMSTFRTVEALVGSPLPVLVPVRLHSLGSVVSLLRVL